MSKPTVGELQAKIEELEGDNFSYREKLRTQKSLVAELQAKVPAEDAVVISADDDVLFKAYQALGTPEEIEQGIADRDTHAGELSSLRRNEELRTVSEIAGYDHDVFATLAGDLKFKIKKGDDGDIVKVRVDEDTKIDLGDYADQHWAKFLPALQPSQGDGETNGQKRRVAPQGTSGKKPDKGDIIGDFIKQRNENLRPSPFDKE